MFLWRRFVSLTKRIAERIGENMKLNDYATKKGKKNFIEGFLQQHKKYLLGRLDKMPSSWNSWHLRRLIRDTIKCYVLSSSEEKKYQQNLKLVIPELKWVFNSGAPDKSFINFELNPPFEKTYTKEQVIELMDQLGKFYKPDLNDYPNVTWHTCGGMASDQLNETSQQILDRLTPNLPTVS